ncbi:hypothetical protein [Georgenia yuyongxinii]|uniref:hypothetical protein n=1 Tax=Georgenia yuyongxinii TaxID=2589797 RepID=UPI00163DC380|nr:hypothetical protein [Georgenia yuyongxinii]
MLDLETLLACERDLAAGDGATCRRGHTRYPAVRSSTYVLRDGVRQLVLHQQTPVT